MSDIMSHYGGSVFAMRGKSSVAIVSDKRLGAGNITTNTSFDHVHRINAHCYIGFSGFVPDSQFLIRKIVKNHDLFCLNERREMTPRELSNMVSYVLYSKRASPYYCSVVVAGLQEGEPFVCGMDQLGSQNESDFVASGTAYEKLLGTSESLFFEGMDEEEIFVTSVPVCLNRVAWDVLSGLGVDCHIISPERVVKRSVKARQY